eukprot:4225718-Amphidinium_carterae.1
MDCAPQHLAAELKQAKDEELPDMTFCFIPHGCTSMAQPLDIAYFRPMKAHIKRSWTRAAVGQILAQTNECGIVSNLPVLKADIAHM